MRRAIVDNSTLTAVQRLTGDIPVYNKYSLDGDILAFENLIQTILFFDEIYYIDDYKEEHREKRLNKFTYMDGIMLNEKDYDAIINETNRLMKSVVPVVEGGTFKDDNFAPFFELLKMNNIFTWDMSSSVYYLTQKMLNGVGNELNVEEFSKMTQMIFTENNDYFNKIANPKKKIVDASGNEISSEGCGVIDKDGNGQIAYVSRQTNLFLANLSWLAYRTIFYTLFTNTIGGTLILHPIRNAFQISYLNKISGIFNNVYCNIISSMNKRAEERLKSIYQHTEPFLAKYVLPIFSVAIISKAKTPTEAINMALHMKYEGDFEFARMRLMEIEELYAEGVNIKAIQEANKLLLEIEKMMYQLGEKYYVHTRQGISLSPIIQAYNIGSAISSSIISPIPNFTPQIKTLGRLKDLTPQRGFNAVYKSIINDLATIGRLGNYYEMLTTEVVYHERADYYTSKTEEEKYRYSKSYWKIPM